MKLPRLAAASAVSALAALALPSSGLAATDIGMVAPQGATLADAEHLVREEREATGDTDAAEPWPAGPPPGRGAAPLEPWLVSPATGSA